MGKRGAISAPDEVDEHAVRGLADHLDQLVAKAFVHRLAGDEGLVPVGAPPMEVVATLAPVTALPSADRRRDVSIDVALVDAPERQLPADLGLPVEWALAAPQCRLVQRT